MPTAAETVVHHLPLEQQRELVEESRRVTELCPFIRPHTPGGKPMRVLVSNCGTWGWMGAGEYRYTQTDARGNLWPPMPSHWRDLATEIAGEHPWDSALINFYAPGSGLGWHRDLAEQDLTLPIVTISLGDAASWAVRASEAAPVTRTRLESGDVTLLAGPSRGYFHSIERIIPAPLLSPLRKPGRVSITLRVAGGVR